MKRLTAVIAAVALIGTPAFAADMAVAPAPVPYSWTGFYGGIQVGGGWSDQAANYSANDPATAIVICACSPFGPNPGQQPLANGYRISQFGAVGGFEAGYNWQAGSNWLLGLEADFSFSGMSGHGSGTSNLSVFPLPLGTLTQTTTAEQSTDWYGTVRGRAGWLATPNLLLFGTGGLAYGRVAESANYALTGPPSNFPGLGAAGNFGFFCPASGAICLAGSSSAIRTGWTAGGGAEWLFDEHWSAKIEYQFVDLGTQIVRVTANCPFVVCGNLAPSSFNAAFRDSFNVVRLGVNYRF